ncbi:transmembrane protein, putative [Medicago truncatula]|uniref:Transmembrane protein, putative n=1 Tax=Medicago truncatula TaxID=3880 RepID=G7K3M5_MEDTR|nr:transmembrane protein, putative [Medicago truncatula]
MVLVPANMPRFGFSPCKVFLLFLVPANMSHFGFGPWLHFCDNLHMCHMMT